jgi:hypothetical protein
VLTVIHNGPVGRALSTDFVKFCGFVRKLLFLQKFNSCIKSEQIVKPAAKRILCTFAGISSTELSTGQDA